MGRWHNLHSIARRNSCTGPWTAALDIHATLKPARWKGSDRVAAAVRLVNVFGFVDELVNGRARARGWGQTAMPDPFLLTPVRFENNARQFRYAVNPHFGRTDGARFGWLNPFLLSVDVRIAIGPDPRRNQFLAAIGRAPGAKGAGPTAEELSSRLAAQFPDPFRMLLEARDSVGLTTAQVSRLEAMQAAYASETDPIWATVVNDLTAPSGQLDIRGGIRKLNDAAIEIQRRQFRWGRAIRESLSPTQRDSAPLFVQHVMFDDESTAEPLIR